MEASEPENDTVCGNCKHTWYDHDGRFTKEERAEILKHRVIGCRVCGCGKFEAAWNGYDCYAEVRADGTQLDQWGIDRVSPTEVRFTLPDIGIPQITVLRHNNGWITIRVSV